MGMVPLENRARINVPKAAFGVRGFAQQFVDPRGELFQRYREKVVVVGVSGVAGDPTCSHPACCFGIGSVVAGGEADDRARSRNHEIGLYPLGGISRDPAELSVSALIDPAEKVGRVGRWFRRRETAVVKSEGLRKLADLIFHWWPKRYAGCREIGGRSG